MQESYKVVGTIVKASKSVSLEVQGQSVAGIQISGTFSGTLQFEGTIDGTNWIALLFKVPSTGVEASSSTGTGAFVGSVAGLKAIRVRASALASGSVGISIITALAGDYGSLTTLNSVFGTTADAAVSTDTTGSLSGKIRGLVKILADVWDSVLHSLGVNMVTGLNKTDDAVTSYPKAPTYIPLSASGQILAIPGQILGFYVNSTSSGVIHFSNALTSTTPVLGGDMTPAVGWHPYPFDLTTGGYMTLVSGSINITVAVIPN